MWAAASAARFAVRHRMPTIASLEHAGGELAASCPHTIINIPARVLQINNYPQQKLPALEQPRRRHPAPAEMLQASRRGRNS